MAVAKIDVFHPKAHAFHETQASAVEEFGHKMVIPFQAVEHSVGFCGRKDYGDFGRAFYSLDFIDEVEFAIEDLLIKKEEGAESLVLGGGGNVSLDSEMGEKCGHFVLAHLGRMPFPMKKDVATNPVEVGLFGADAVVLHPQVPPNSIEEAGW